MCLALPGKFSELVSLAAGGGVIAASVKDASGFEARGSVGVGEAPLLLCLERLAVISNVLELTDFAVVDCGRAAEKRRLATWFELS